MMKRLISLVLILTTLLSICSITANAAGEEEFLSEVALVYEDSVEKAKAAIAGTDWKLFEQDLNPNADYMFDDGVYLIYKTSTNVEDAITDLRVMDMYGGYSTANYEKQLEASRSTYMKFIGYIRTAATEFAALYADDDEMAKIAYRQMNYYKDIGETNLSMGDFLLNIPSDEALVTVLMEGNALIVTNLITLLAVGISGTGSDSMAVKISDMYSMKDLLLDVDYYDAAAALAEEFKELAARIKRYDVLAEEHDFKDEEMSEDEYFFLHEYASIAMMLEQIPYGETTLKDFLGYENWRIQDLYPVVAALSDGQLALSNIGLFTTVLQYSSPSKPIEALYEILEENEKEFTDENGNLEQYDVYMGVDRSIFEGNFAFTNEAERQQALTGKEWTADYYLSKKANDQVPYPAVKALIGAGTVVGLSPSVATYFLNAGMEAAEAISEKALDAYCIKWRVPIKFICGGVENNGFGYKLLLSAGIGLLVAALGVIGVSIWYGYYNPDYTPIPDTLIDVRETDLGDNYIKYTAAKVFEKGNLSEKNADLNAYEGKEWNALYYTKDANAGKSLTPNFVYKDNDASIARRHQGICMFGEGEAFNLNSHVFSKNAPGVYVTMRYSTAKKAAADLPDVVGSMLDGALYAVIAIGGVAIGVGTTVLVQNVKKKKAMPEAT